MEEIKLLIDNIDNISEIIEGINHLTFEEKISTLKKMQLYYKYDYNHEKMIDILIEKDKNIIFPDEYDEILEYMYKYIVYIYNLQNIYNFTIYLTKLLDYLIQIKKINIPIITYYIYKIKKINGLFNENIDYLLHKILNNVIKEYIISLHITDFLDYNKNNKVYNIIHNEYFIFKYKTQEIKEINYYKYPILKYKLCNNLHFDDIMYDGFIYTYKPNITDSSCKNDILIIFNSDKDSNLYKYITNLIYIKKYILNNYDNKKAIKIFIKFLINYINIILTNTHKDYNYTINYNLNKKFNNIQVFIKNFL